MALAQLSAIRTALEAALNTIAGLTNYKEEPDAIPSPPFTVLGNTEIDFSTDMGGGHNLTFRLFFAVAEATSSSAFGTLDGFLASIGSTSLKAAIEAATIGNGYATVRRAENVGHVRYRDRTFVGGELVIHVESGG